MCSRWEFSKSVHQFFLNCTWWQALKGGSKWLFRFLKKIYILLKWDKWDIVRSKNTKIQKVHICSHLFIMFFQTFMWWQLEVNFFKYFFRNTFIMSKERFFGRFRLQNWRFMSFIDLICLISLLKINESRYKQCGVIPRF